MKTLDQKPGIQIFKNRNLDRLSRTNPGLHVLTYGSVIAFFFCRNSLMFKQTILIYFSGLFMWTLMEYVLHRYIFHISIPRFQYIIHGIHHTYPRDKERILMPPVPGLIIISVLYLFWFLILGVYVHAFMAGIITGYMAYSTIHYTIHTYKPIKGFKFFWSHHMKHHNPKLEDKAFGVTSPLWDWIFRTMP